MSCIFKLPFFLVIALNLIGFRASGQDKLIQKSKSYSKSYQISDGDKISINNKFGEVKVITWNKSEIKVECTIKVQSNDEMLVQALLDNIEIRDTRTKGAVNFSTAINRANTDKSKKNNKKDESMNINYVVSLPSTAKLLISNQFGAIVLPDYVGELNLESQFGSVSSGKLLNLKSINIKFGDVDMSYINNGLINAQYANVNLKNIGGDVKGDFQFSTVYLNVDSKTAKVSFKDAYTNTIINLVRNVTASFKVDATNTSLQNKTALKIDKKTSSNGRIIYEHNMEKSSFLYDGSSSNGSIVIGHDIKPKIKKKNTF